MTTDQEKKRVNQDPLHGITLKEIMIQLFEKYGWEELRQRVKIKCFTDNPSITSSLKFLRKTPWARKEVEELYLKTEWPKKDVWANSRNRNKT